MNCTEIINIDNVLVMTIVKKITHKKILEKSIYSFF